MLEQQSQEIMRRAVSLANEQGFAICLSVVDDPIPGAIEVVIKKARTAALFRTDSAEIGTRAQPGGDITPWKAPTAG